MVSLWLRPLPAETGILHLRGSGRFSDLFCAGTQIFKTVVEFDELQEGGALARSWKGLAFSQYDEERAVKWIQSKKKQVADYPDGHGCHFSKWWVRGGLCLSYSPLDLWHMVGG